MKSKASKFAFNFFDALAIDPTNLNLSVTQFYEALVEQLGLDVEKSEWKTELVFDGQGRAVLNKDGTQKRKKYKLRRISCDSWKWFELFCEHRQAMKERRDNQEEMTSDRVPRPTCRSRQVECGASPTPSKNLYETEVGWNRTQAHTGQRIEGDFKGGKFDAMTTTVTPNIDKSLASTNTQTAKSNDVPTIPENLYETDGGWNSDLTQTEKGNKDDFSTQKNDIAIATTSNFDESLLRINTLSTDRDDVPTTPQNLYEVKGGWNTNQKQTEQEIESDFKEEKFELTDEEIQACLKELRQVNTADNYWEIYNQCPRLLTQAWNRLNFFEQLRIQQICD